MPLQYTQPTTATSTSGIYYPVTMTSSAATTTASYWVTTYVAHTYTSQWQSVAQHERTVIDAFMVNQQAQQRRSLSKHVRKAKKRARDLLLSKLTQAQRETFEANKWFIVEGGESGTRYRIRERGDLVANIDVVGGEDQTLHRLCGHARLADCPMEDHLLTQKLWLENAEREFLLIANRHAA
jgi:hypothetical protein